MLNMRVLIIDTHMLYLLLYNDLVGVHNSCLVIEHEKTMFELVTSIKP